MNRPVEFPKRLFVTGTDTGVGKTVVSAVLCKGLDASYWKPVQAGTEPETDTESVRKWTGLPAGYFCPESYKLKEPMSPHAAAEMEGIDINLDNVQLPDVKKNNLIVEGAGGIMVPVNRYQYIRDIIIKLGLPVLLVARSGLGTINHTLLSLDILYQMNIPVFGVVLNGDYHSSNTDAIRHFGAVERLFSMTPLPDLSPEGLNKSFYKTFSTYAS